ncbi:MAG TPA: EamA family transporter [Dongiaceae bacterium]|nr:EamA family transporter [Dongiaceae bacterium]
MLGGFLALVAAVTFAMNNAAFRRGALTGTVAQAMAISLLLGLLIFAVATVLAGATGAVTAFPMQSVLMLCGAGVLHFAWGRYCNFRATKAMGANLVGPAQQFSIVVTLCLAIFVLDEALTPLRIIGILLVVLAPAVSLRLGQARPGPAAPALKFHPNYVEGYTFAFLSAIGYGSSPILVRLSLQDGGIGASIAGGLIAYAAATIVMAIALLAPGTLRHVLSVDRISGKWFSASGALVCLSQMFGYMALAVAPVSVVIPIQRLSLVFRVYANSVLNREHEVVGGRIWAATGVALLGALALSVSVEDLLAVLPLPDALEDLARWRWS